MNYSKLNTKALTAKIGLPSKQKWCINFIKKNRGTILGALKERRSYFSFLNGQQGKVKAERYRLIDLFNGKSTLLRGFLQIQKRYFENRGVKGETVLYDFNTEKVRYTRDNLVKEIRIGKHLKNLYNFSIKQKDRSWPVVLSNAMAIWENRGLDWEWYISTDPKDIYTMSTGRPWKSCMEVSASARSIILDLSDRVADGSALIFFCRNNHVCGRRVLTARASLKKNPILYIGDLYGSGPSENDVIETIRRTLSSVKTPGFNIQVYSYINTSYQTTVGEYPWDNYSRSLIKKVDHAWKKRPIVRPVL